MKNILIIFLFSLINNISHATVFVIVVPQSWPTFNNLCPGDTLRFTGDSTNQDIYGTIMVSIENTDSLNDNFPISSDTNLATSHDHILLAGDFYYLYTPFIGNGSILFNCISTVEDVSEETSIQVMPNPVSHTLEIKTSANQLAIYDMLGNLQKKVFKNGYSEVIDISDLRSGIYILTADNEIEHKRKLFVKQ